VAATNIVFTHALFPTTTHLIDFQAQAPTVQPGDPWAGQQIGVRLRSSLVDTNLVGGYWDLDNVRLHASQAPALRDAAWADGQFQFRLTSEPGLSFELLASSELTLALANWTRLDTVTNFSGDTMFTNTATGTGGRFFQARQLP
jgi:hypothetical protein